MSSGPSILIFLCGLSAANTVGAAARRSYFYPLQVALLVPGRRGVPGVAGDRPTMLLGLAIPVYFVVMMGLPGSAHRGRESSCACGEQYAGRYQQFRASTSSSVRSPCGTI